MIRTPCFIESLRLASSLQSQIMEAKNSQIGIYAWKTILMGGKLLKQGEKRKVGEGKSITLWDDFWLQYMYVMVRSLHR